MWVEFIVDSLVCSERFLSRYSGFSDVVKEYCWVAVGHDGFVDLFIWGQSHHIIADVVTGHVDVPHVLILLLG